MLIWLIKKLKNFIKRGEEEVAVVYVTLIINGKRDFEDVPVRLRDQVRNLLIELELSELISE